MSDKGIIFSAPMVLALLSGRKTQTRRLIKPQPIPAAASVQCVAKVIRTNRPAFNFLDHHGDPLYAIPTRHGYDGEYVAPFAPGDRLYVREAHRHWSLGHDCDVTYLADGSVAQIGPNEGRIPEASLAAYFARCDRSVRERKAVGYPSIHMPRWASRLWLDVKDVRVERVQSISREDAIAEGIERSGGGMLRWERWSNGIEGQVGMSPQAAFAMLWNSLHAAPGERWDDDPWVVAVSFEVHRGNIDQ